MEMSIHGDKRYRAFISYSHRDKKVAAWVQSALERYHIPANLVGRETAVGTVPPRLHPLFRDRDELPASGDLGSELMAALSQSMFLILICSPAAAKSHWVNQEVLNFKRMHGEGRVLALICDGEPGDPERECFPKALQYLIGTDGALSDKLAEPIAADMRKHADGKRLAKFKLIAGLTGLRLDDLIQREAARRARRLTLIAAGATIGMIGALALAFYANTKRIEAIAQRKTAERTVEFVKSLFEVSDPSEARGASITAREVLDKGAVSIETSLDNEPDVKAALMTTLAQVYLGLGSYKRGEAIMKRAMQVPAADPGVKARRLMAMGSSAYRQGDYRVAADHYRRALPLAAADELSAAELRPAILAAVGDAMARAGDTSAGPDGMLEALRTDMADAGADSLAVARDLEALGVFEQTRDNLAAARGYYERALAIRIARQGLSHPLVSEDLNELGSIAYLQQDSVAAEGYWRRTLEADLLVLGPDHPDVAITLNNLARVMLEQRKFESALPLLKRAVDITVRNRSADNDYLALLYANLGIAQRGVGDRATAKTSFQSALRVAEITDHRNLGPILTELADLACTSGNAKNGLALLDRAEPSTRKNYPDDPWRLAWLQNTRGACLVANGDVPAGRALLGTNQVIIASRWDPPSLYGWMAARRLAAAGI
jgi:tetratricopeptide (TPR) repeat protein